MATGTFLNDTIIGGQSTSERIENWMTGMYVMTAVIAVVSFIGMIFSLKK